MWPYLEQFALDAGAEITKELGGHKPDLIIGNYSDGNLVATLLAYHQNVTQCTIAHALEKTKYANADIHWCGLSSITSSRALIVAWHRSGAARTDANVYWQSTSLSVTSHRHLSAKFWPEGIQTLSARLTWALLTVQPSSHVS